MNIIGIDPAARKLAIWCGVDSVFEKLPMDDTEACGLAFRVLSEYLTDRDPADTVIYMEKPLVGRGGVQNTLVQVLVHGALRAAASEFRVELRGVDVGTWKKNLLGNGHADKDEIAAYAKKRDPLLYDRCNGNQDLIDALAIYWYGCKNYQVIEKARKLAARKKQRK